MNFAQNLIRSGVKQINLEDLFSGIEVTVKDTEAELSQDEMSNVLNKYFGELQHERDVQKQMAIKRNKEDGEKFLKENAKQEDVKTTESGLQYKIISKGTGAFPTRHSTVKCHYEGRLLDGTVFDSSYKRGEPISFGLDHVIAGWTEGLQLMPVGSKFEFYIPYNLAYDENGMPGVIPPCATLIFTVELLDIN